MIDARCALALSYLPGVGPGAVRECLELPLSFPLVRGHVQGASRRLVAALEDEGTAEKANRQALRALAEASRIGLTLLVLGEAHYPRLLGSTRDAPPLVFIEGSLPPERAVAVIGTRKPTKPGVVISRRVTVHLVAAGWSVVSGLAQGIDASAHEAALDAGGTTIAVLAHGLDITYPAAHSALRRLIVARGGCVISAYPPGIAVASHRLVARDRVQAGLSAGVICVQTAKSGGSLHASRAALDYGRVLAVAAPPVRLDEGYFAGNQRMLQPDGRAFLGTGPLGRILPLSGREDYRELDALVDEAPGVKA